MRKLNKFLLVVIALTIVAMTVGYSALNSTLNITGDLNYRAQDDTRITGFTANSKPSQMTIEYSDYSKHEVKLGYTTTGACSITYTVEVKNSSGVNMGILSINGLDNDVVVQSDIIGKKLVGPVSTSTFTITFNSTVAETKTYLLTIEFGQIFDITYSGLDNTDSYIKEVLEGGQLKQNLGKDSDVCSVTMKGSNYTGYTFSNETITIPSVTGNVVINGYAPTVEEPTAPNPPELNGDMIPVYYYKIDDKNGEWRKADENNLNNSWYNYANQEWANAVTIIADRREEVKKYDVDTPIDMDYINTMWVWIPRYSYTIKSEDGTNYYGKKTSCTMPTRTLPGEIDVKFISKEDERETGSAQYTGDKASGWYTNEAFDFPETDEEDETNTPKKRGGIWVSKFEPTGTVSSCTNTSCNVSSVTVKPGIASIRSKTVSNFYFMSRSMQLNNASTYGFDANNGDLHMMKNDEWGAVAYLSQSRYGKYGNSDYTGANKEVYINNDSNKVTGHSGGGPSVSSSATNWYEYNDMTNLGTGRGEAGPGASTTGNITGIYDMSGGAYEYVMGVLEYDEQGVEDNEGKIATGSSGFKGLSSSGSSTGSYDLPNEKYYNKYKSAKPTSYSFPDVNLDSACNGGKCYGHALGETYGASSGYNGWYGDYAYFVSRGGPWFRRGGYYGDATGAGVFSADHGNGNSVSSYSCRLAFAP